MKRIYGILILLAVVYVLTAILSPGFLSGFNQENLLRRTALFGILGVGVAFVIITGGIDLSIGSIVALAGVSLPWFITQWGWHPAIVVLLVLGLPLLLGYAHGWLVTRMRLQPFIVTLCGLLIYRGLARGVTRDQTAGFGSDFRALRWLAQGELPLGPAFGIPITVLIFAIVAVLAAVFLNKTIYGRYLLALGNNEEAARFSGIDTDRMTILAYVICSGLAGLGGMLFVLDLNLAQPSDFGNFYELFAIAAAVLGGCSLRGGQGTILGVIVGTALIQVLRNMITLVFPKFQYMEFAVMGGVILAGVIADEVARRTMARRKVAAAREVPPQPTQP